LCISAIIPHLINVSLSFILLRESLSLLNRRSIARISFAILVTYLRTILMHAETAIAKYTLTFSVPVEVVVVLKVVPGVLGISKRVKEAAAE